MPSAISSAAVAPSAAFPFIERLRQSAANSTERPRRLRCYGVSTAGRGAVEAYIAGTFRAQYDARIDHFLPWLLTIEANGAIEAALGIRFAESGPLFVGQYLDRPVPDELAQRGFATRAVVEIGNLVSTRAGCSQLLFILLAELLDTLGRDTGIFTATPQVQQLLGKLGCELTTLCDADGARLGERLEQWGRYYDTAPRVVVSTVAATARALHNRPALARTFAEHDGEIAQAAALLCA